MAYWHGLEEHSSLSVSHWSPKYPRTHIHWKPFTRSCIYYSRSLMVYAWDAWQSLLDRFHHSCMDLMVHSHRNWFHNFSQCSQANTDTHSHSPNPKLVRYKPFDWELWHLILPGMFLHFHMDLVHNHQYWFHTYHPHSPQHMNRWMIRLHPMYIYSGAHSYTV